MWSWEQEGGVELNGQELEAGVGGEQDPDIEKIHKEWIKCHIKQNLLAFMKI